ncbi:hypothetical protein JXA05_03455 [Candidatus Peregrinibacteria bacterium]|nr:hypothetical protein [Candidatus Peregrinibacteria bacterium]
MPKKPSAAALNNLPDFKIWGEHLKDVKNARFYKGKFVLTDAGKFIAKLFPREKYAAANLYHNHMLAELGVEKPESPAVKKEIAGGGKIEIELIGDYMECRLFGESQTYGKYNAFDIDLPGLEKAVGEAFGMGGITVLVIPDYENVSV